MARPLRVECRRGLPNDIKLHFEGFKTSSALRDVKFEASLTLLKDDAPVQLADPIKDELNATVFRPNIVVQKLKENQEEDPGAFIGLKSEPVKAKLILRPKGTKAALVKLKQGVFTLSKDRLYASNSGGDVKFWKDRKKTTPPNSLTWNLANGDNIPSALFVEGISVSAQSPDVAINFNSSGILGECEDKALATVFKIKLMEIWEKDSLCNKVPNNKPTTKKRLFVAVEPANQAELVIKTESSPENVQFVWGILDRNKLLNETGIIDADNETNIVFRPTGSCDDKVFKFAVGYDANNDGKLQKKEIIKPTEIPEFTSIVVKDSDYQKRLSQLKKLRAPTIFPFGTTCLNIFIRATSTPVSASSVENDTVSANASNPEHIAGAVYNPNSCKATIKKYIYGNGSLPSNSIENAGILKVKINKLLDKNKGEIVKFFNNNPSENFHIFNFDFTHATPIKFSFADLDLRLSLGQSLLDGEVFVAVSRNGQKLKIDGLNINANVHDIYDFNFERPKKSLSRKGATVEIGWQAPKKKAGKIFKIKINIKKNFPNYNYDLNK